MLLSSSLIKLPISDLFDSSTYLCDLALHASHIPPEILLSLLLSRGPSIPSECCESRGSCPFCLVCVVSQQLESSF